MNFELNEEQTLIRNMVREFVESDINPLPLLLINSTVSRRKVLLQWLN